MLERLHQRSCRKRKKLAQVARLWARDLLHIPTGASDDDQETQFDDALVALGLTQDAGANDPDAPPSQKCYLWPCNVLAFNVWTQIQTQWRTSAMGGRVGLDYAGVEAWLRSRPGLRPRARKELMQGLQAMELSALNAWAQQSKT